MSRVSGFASRGAAALAFVVSFAAISNAAAQSGIGGTVGLEVRACAEPFESSLRGVLRIELRDLLDETNATKPTEGVRVRCEAEFVRISAHSTRGARVVSNDVRLAEFPSDAAPRAVALAALEALRAVDPTLAGRVAARPAPTASGEAVARDEPREPKRSVADAKRAAPPTNAAAALGKRSRAPVLRAETPDRAPSSAAAVSRPWSRLLVGGAVRSFLGVPRTTSVGARVELSRRFASPFDAGSDLEVAFARRRVVLGEAETRLLSIGGWFGARAGGAVWSGTAALGGRAGLAELRGSPTETSARGHEVIRAFAGPMLVLRGDGAVSALAFALMLEGGWAAAGAEGLADQERAIGLTRGWIAASLSVGLRR